MNTSDTSAPRAFSKLALSRTEAAEILGVSAISIDRLGHKDGGVLVAKTYGHLRDTHSHEMAKRMTFSA